jgi:hypothetical protein
VIVESGPVAQLGIDAEQAVLRFTESDKAAEGWAGRRQLTMEGKPAFQLSSWCGTCPAMFERLQGATRTLSLEHLAERLRSGLDGVDQRVMREFGRLLPSGRYLPLLLEVVPRLVRPVEAGDYFAHEQVATWGLDAFWGLPENPRTPYYRTYQTPVSHQAHLYEFVVPMVPPSWNERSTVTEYEALLARSHKPTAVAISTLDICAPAIIEEGKDWYQHWMLTHFLLDGHHKFEAAAMSGRPLRLLALVSLAGSLASVEDVRRLTNIRRRVAQMRPFSA